MNAASNNSAAANSSMSANSNANTTTAANSAANKNLMMGGRRRGSRKAGKKGRKGTRKMRGGAGSTLSVPAHAAPAHAAAAHSTLSRPMLGGGKVAAVGSKAQVWHGTAKHTAGGLTKKDLMKHKGRIVSKKKHALGKKAFKRLVKAGFKPKRGTFKLFRK